MNLHDLLYREPRLATLPIKVYTQIKSGMKDRFELMKNTYTVKEAE